MQIFLNTEAIFRASKVKEVKVKLFTTSGYCYIFHKLSSQSLNPLSGSD